MNSANSKAASITMPSSNNMQNGGAKKGGMGANMIALTVLTVSSCAQTLFVGFAVSTDFIKPTSVVCAETLKVLASLVMIYRTESNPIEHIKEQVFNKKTFAIMSVPAVLYAIVNILTLYIVMYLSPALFGILSQTKIATTALWCRILLDKRLAYNQMSAISALMIGVILVNLAQRQQKSQPTSEDSDASSSTVLLGIGLALTQAVLSGFCGAYLEKQFKNTSDGATIWSKNIQLGVIGALITSVMIASTSHGSRVAEEGFFASYSPSVVIMIALSACGGILNALVMKLADNIVKGFAVGISLVGTTLLSPLFFDFKLDIATLCGCGIVVASTFMYSGQIMLVDKDLSVQPAIVRMAGIAAALIAFGYVLLSIS